MLTRYDPFREMLTLRRAMDRMFDRALDTDSEWQPVTWNLALDVAENKDEFLVKASIPGIHPDDLDITYADNVLTIKGETKEEKEIKEDQYHLRERRFGSFARSVTLPNKIQGDAIEARYEAGVLTLRLPKVEEAKPKKIAIHVPKVIEAGNKK